MTKSRHRTSTPLQKAVAFFKEHYGAASRLPGETEREAVKRNSHALARAEAEAYSRGWRVEWQHDPEPYEMGNAETEMPSEVLGAVLRDAQGNVLASLWGIGDPTRAYRRIVEAQLASEALYEEKK